MKNIVTSLIKQIEYISLMDLVNLCKRLLILYTLNGGGR